MSTRLLGRMGALAAAIAMVVLASAPLAGQAPPAIARTTTTATANNWTPPRTPWGDPDLQGIYTNKYEQGTPFERPDEFTGRRLEDIKSTELAEIVQDRQDRVLLSVTLAGGDPAGNLGGPLHWQDQFEITKGSRPWFVLEPSDGKIPSTTANAQKRAAARQLARRGRGPADSWEDRSFYDRCITRGLPGSMMPAIYGNSYQIVQAPGYVAIRYEMVHETRIIPLDEPSHVGQDIRQHMGDARGRWEGNTLVIETRNFRNETVYRGGNPNTLRLIERFTRVGPGRVEWTVTVEDPETWTQPWTFAVPLTMNDSEQIMEYACHEGNRAMANILSAARADEKAGRTRDIPTAAEGER